MAPSTIAMWPALAFAGLAACVESPPFASPDARLTPDDIPCDGAPPSCVHSCDTPIARDPAFCRAGKWTCERGIRADLCCDALADPTSCAPWGPSCGAERPCPRGYTCVSSRGHPVPSDDGLCRLGDMTIPGALTQCDDAGIVDPARLSDLAASPLKARGIVHVRMRCDDDKCSPDAPCCQSCAGSYDLELTDAHGDRTFLPIRTEYVACAGTNCAYTCQPLQPGRRYLVWGRYVPNVQPPAVGMLYLAGYCPD